MNEQFKTYQTRQKIQRSIKTRTFEPYHYSFIINFLKKNRKKIIAVLSLLFIQALMEVLTLIFISGSIQEQAFNAFHQNKLTLIFIILSLGIVGYLAISFFALKLERETVLDFINKLRRSWFFLILNRSEGAMTNERKADFIAKASYHFPLVSLGIDNSALGIIRWALCGCILLIVSSTTGIYLILGSILIIIGSILIGFIAYLIAKHYVSQEVTSYSKVLRHIDLSLSEFAFIKTFKQEISCLKDLNAVVAVDTYFRVRRDLWLRYFRKIIYILFFIGSLVLIITNIYHPEIFSRLYIDEQNFIIGILSLYALRLFYESGRVGLYVPPLLLGISLSIPPRTIKESDRKEIPWSFIEFRSNKTKLYQEGNYFKNIALLFEKGKRYLFIAEPRQGKTSLAELFAGKMRFNRNGWLVKMDKERFDYRHWATLDLKSFFISPYFHSEKTIGEIILAKEKYTITAEDLFSLYALAEKHPFLTMVVSKKRFVGESLRCFEANNSLLFAVYVLHCLYYKPNLILIDNLWLDLNDPPINSLIALMADELKDVTIIVFSRNNNDIIPYHEKYQIQINSIQHLKNEKLKE